MEALNFPNNIQIETTSRCNAGCFFCPYPETSQSQPMGVMDDALFEAIVEEISQHPVQLIQPFLNNEPLMDNDIISRLELIIRKNPKARVCITTNGVLLRKEIIRELSKMPLDTIHISSNGLTKVTYRETMQIDAYTVLHNVNVLLDTLKAKGSKIRLVITAILLKSNKHEIEHQRRYWKARGVSYYLNPLNDRAGNIESDAFEAQLPFGAEANRSQLLRFNMSGCPSIYSFMGIHWNGDVIACCNDWRRANVLGNVRQKSLAEIWHDRPYQHMRRLNEVGRLNDLSLCDACGNNKFMIDPGAVRDLIEKQPSLTREECDADVSVLSMLENARSEDEAFPQLGLLR